MTFWNRQEIYCGNSELHFARIQAKLAEADIACKARIKRHTMLPGQGRGRTSIDEAAVLYYIYVDKRDAERAAHLAEQAKRG